MTERWTTEDWEGAIRAVFRRALLDSRFRELAKQSPREAFTEVTGRVPPTKLRFVESLDEHVLVLPQLVQTDGALSEIDVSRILHHSFRQQSIPPAWGSDQC